MAVFARSRDCILFDKIVHCTVKIARVMEDCNLIAMVSEPGVYSMDSTTYHSDPCPTPSMSAGTVDWLIDHCPAKAWANHPRLNPDFKPKTSRVFDIGLSAHIMALEPEQFDDAVQLIKSDSYRPDWAQQARRRARAQGKIPLLVEEHDMLIGMRQELRSYPLSRDAFRDGKAEKSVFAQNKKNGVWRRIRPDLTAYHSGWLADYKAMASSNPAEFGKQADNFNWYRRAAWYIDTFYMATGKRPSKYYFIVQEKEPPYLVTVNELLYIDLEAGQTDCEEAERIFAECLKRGTKREAWPGYRDQNTPNEDRSFVTSMPSYAHFRIQERHERWNDAARQRAVDRFKEPI